ncbi:hypothetical protein [Streptomyces sp. NPDC018031]|uniref:hypothetical protein n=1 Tax=Streptomyces sp. NPDC018031 TaxID=3365033 RepID=UPI00378FDFE8
MTERAHGQWPVEKPVPLDTFPVPVCNQQPAEKQPHPEVPVPDVRLVVTVDLTGPYDSSSDVTRDLYEQTRHSTDCHTAIVHLGEDAQRCSPDLGHAIAARFFLAARSIEIHVPAGARWAFIASEVQQHLRSFASDHAAMLSKTRSPG